MFRLRSRPSRRPVSPRTFRPGVQRLEDRSVPSALASGAAAPAPAARELTVMTRNLYVGADLGPVATAPNLLAASEAAGVAYAQVQATNFPERAEALADEIAERLPTLVGLQEVSQVLSGPAFDPAPAAAVEYDYLATLLGELAERGLNYQVVAEVTVFDGELPIRTGGAFTQDLRLIDREVILARGDLPVSELRLSNVRTGHFAAHLAVPVGGAGGPLLSFDRGWASVDARVRGKTVRFITTHLEPDSPVPAIDAIQVAQGDELLAGPAATDLPVILVGDFNSRADGTGTATYGRLIGAGFTDCWSATHPGELGNTAFFDADLRDPTDTLSERLDLVLFRGDLRAFAADVLGDELADRTPSGLWPSDHAGVVATLGLHVRPSTVPGAGTAAPYRGGRTNAISIGRPGEGNPRPHETFAPDPFGASGSALLLDAAGLGPIWNDDKK
jgi:endonuclease/exonuclease/phosphatase family metal-dependent hydrolase